MDNSDLAIKAHLLRRAGFGASRTQLEEIAKKEYEEIVEDLLHPERFDELNEDYLKRFNVALFTTYDSFRAWSGRWIWRMINSERPLEEKMTLFWHHVFATAWFKSEHHPSIIAQNEMFRRDGLTNIRNILSGLAKDPAMNYWLDNCENHSDQPNENWGRELLELFSMGVGNYTEEDIKNAARAFTGWTFEQPVPLYPFGNYESSFIYDEDDHDDGVKTFLGQKGNLNGEDIIEIICTQRATARFISRHIYTFFVEDEPQVHTWSIEHPRNPEAIDAMTDVFLETGGDIKSLLRYVFNSEFFKQSQFKKVKSPAEIVSGTIKLAGTYGVFPEIGETVAKLHSAVTVMGQELMNPPTVEGWHTGSEWIDGGTLTERVNFAVNQFDDTSTPGFQEILGRLGDAVKGEDLLEKCLELLGPLQLGEESRSALGRYADAVGDLDLGTDQARTENADKISRMIQLIVSTREYQFA